MKKNLHIIPWDKIWRQSWKDICDRPILLFAFWRCRLQRDRPGNVFLWCCIYLKPLLWPLWSPAAAPAALREPVTACCHVLDLTWMQVAGLAVAKERGPVIRHLVHSFLKPWQEFPAGGRNAAILPSSLTEFARQLFLCLKHALAAPESIEQ